jgi:hypothetical protein
MKKFSFILIASFLFNSGLSLAQVYYPKELANTGSGNLLNWNTETYDHFVTLDNGNTYRASGSVSPAQLGANILSLIMDTSPVPPGTPKAYYPAPNFPETSYSSIYSGVARNNKNDMASFGVATKFGSSSYMFNLTTINVSSRSPVDYYRSFFLNEYATGKTGGGFKAYSIELDDSMNVYVGGDANTNPLVINGQSFTAGGTTVVSVDSAGNPRWVRQVSISSSPASGSVRIKMRSDKKNFLYVLVYGTGLLKIDLHNGNLIRTTTLPCYVHDFELNDRGDVIYLAGDMSYGLHPIYSSNAQGMWWSYASGSLQSYVSLGSTTLYAQNGSYNYIASMDSSGNWLWAKNLPAYPRSIKFSRISRKLFLGGDFKDSAYFASGAKYSYKGNHYISCFDSAGNEQWNFVDTFYTGFHLENIGLDTMGNIYAGFHNGFPGYTMVRCTTLTSLVIAKFSPSGPYVLPKPTRQVSNFKTLSVTSNMINMFLSRGNGTEFIVIARKDSAVSRLPVDGATYTASQNFGQGDHLGDGNYVLYKGTSSFFYLAGALNNTRYHFAAFELFDCGGNEQYLLDTPGLWTDSSRAFTTYYTKSSGPIDSLGSWGINPDGSGPSPASFSLNNMVYKVVNNPAPYVKSNLTFFGTNLQMEIGNGTSPITLHLDSGKLEFPGKLRIRSGATVIASRIIYSKDTLSGDSGSRLELSTPLFTRSGSWATIPGVWKVYDLALLGGHTYILLTTRLLVANRLEMTGNILANIHLGTNEQQAGTLVRSGGLIAGEFARWVRPIAPQNLLFPIAHHVYNISTGEDQLSDRSLFIQYTSAPTQGGKLRVRRNVGWNTISGLPLSDTTAGPTVSLNSFINPFGPWQIDTMVSPKGGTFNLAVTDTHIYNGPYYLSGLRLMSTKTISGSSWLATIDGIAANNSGTIKNPIVWRAAIDGNAIYGFYGVMFDSNMLGIPNIQWLTFNANVAQNDVQLDWSTGNETSNSHFELERSVNGLEFVYIGAVNGNGTTSSTSNYQFTDSLPFVKTGSDTLYYRMRNVTFQGAYEYYQIRMVYKLPNTGLNENASLIRLVFPNPFNTCLNVSLSTAEDCCLELISSTGIICQHYELSKNSSMELNTKELSAGIYFLKITSARGTEVRKLVKMQ